MPPKGHDKNTCLCSFCNGWKYYNTMGQKERSAKRVLGKKFGLLTVLKFAGIDKQRHEYLWECKCDCGNIRIARTVMLTHGLRSCGCLNTPKRNGEERLLRRIHKKISLTTKGESSTRLKILIGYSSPELRAHLELQFTPEMSWDNYGTYWVIDHIIPQRVFDQKNKLEIALCWALPNLQPLERHKNDKKGGKVNYYPEGFYDHKLEEIRQFVKERINA